MLQSNGKVWKLHLSLTHIIHLNYHIEAGGVDNHGNNDIPFLLLLWKNHEKTYPRVPFGKQLGRSARAKEQQEHRSVGLVIPFSQLPF